MTDGPSQKRHYIRRTVLFIFGIAPACLLFLAAVPSFAAGLGTFLAEGRPIGLLYVAWSLLMLFAINALWQISSGNFRPAWLLGLIAFPIATLMAFFLFGGTIQNRVWVLGILPSTVSVFLLVEFYRVAKAAARDAE